MTVYALLWEFSNAEVMAELSSIEYWFGVVDEKTNMVKPYGGGVPPETRAVAVIASALLRIMKGMKLGDVKHDNKYTRAKALRDEME